MQSQMIDSLFGIQPKTYYPKFHPEEYPGSGPNAAGNMYASPGKISCASSPGYAGAWKYSAEYLLFLIIFNFYDKITASILFFK